MKASVRGVLATARNHRLIAVLAIAASASLLGEPGAGAAPGALPVARLIWSVPSRYELSWKAWNAATATYDQSYVHPQSWSATFDMCGSLNPRGGKPITRYDLKLVGVGFDFTTGSNNAACLKRFHNLPRLGSYQLTYAVETSDGAGPAVTERIEPRDYLIVSLGDSFASGEGSPDVPGRYELRNPAEDLALDLARGRAPALRTVVPVRWQDRRCHRSARSGHALLAKQIEDRDPHTSVTYVSLACSGAEVYEGLLGPYQGMEPPAGTDPLPPQVDVLSRLVGTPRLPRTYRPVDAILLQIGINDLDFHSIIEDCAFNPILDPHLDHPNPFDDPSCVYDHTGGKIVDPHPPASGKPADEDLRTKYRDIGAVLKERFPTAEVYVADYPSKVFRGGGCDLLAGIRSAEAQTIESVGGALRAELQRAAVEQGWNDAGSLSAPGATEAFADHPYCSAQPWFNHVLESLARQGNIDGTAHPNPAGHLALRDVLARSVVVGRATQPLYDVHLVIERVQVGGTGGDETERLSPAAAPPPVPPAPSPPQRPTPPGAGDPNSFSLSVATREDGLGTAERWYRVATAGRLLEPEEGQPAFDLPVYRAPQPGRFLTHVSFLVGGAGSTLGARHGPGDAFGQGRHTISTPRGNLRVQYRIELRRAGEVKAR